MNAQMSSVKRKRSEKDSSDDQPEDQSSLRKSNFILKLSRLQYLDERTADVHFVCGSEGERVPAHKSVLSKASDVFDGMFYGPLAEKDDVTLLETSPEAFKDFLQFCYLNEVTLKLDNITEVIGLAHKYEMTECVELCADFWMDNWSIDEICWAYNWAIHLKLKKFKKFCEHKISIHSYAVFQTEGFLTCRHVVLENILQLNSLLCDESTVLGACLNWARHACKKDEKDASNAENLRFYLKDALYKIRFASIKLNQFSEHLSSNKRLFPDVDDYEDIIRLISKRSDLVTGRFNPNPRIQMTFPWNESRVIDCNVFEINDVIPSGRITAQTYVTELRSNRALLLGGFNIAGMFRFNQSKPISCLVTIKEGTPKNSTVIVVKYRVCDDTEQFFGLTKTPIAIKPQLDYVIEFKFELEFQSSLFPKENFVLKYYRSELTALERQIKLNENVTIQVKPKGEEFFIRSFKFNLL